VRSYPVVERHRWIWIWLGDPALADPALIPDLFWNDGPDWAVTGTYHHCDAEYRLMIDAQLDATHVTYVHPDTLGSSSVQATPPKVERKDDGLTIQRWLIGVEPPPIWALAGGFMGLVDRWILATYQPPTGCLFDMGAAEAGTGAPEGDRSQGITNRTSHFVTPETEQSCHYFWLFARNYRIEDEALSERMKPGVHQTFQEDVDVIEAQQRGLLGGAPPVQIDVNADIATIQARRVLEGLIAAEAAA
jgi:vanillate O-demethylase monooxygenase subunit